MNAYDQKTRKKVLSYRKTHTKSDASRKFNIARHTIFMWEKQSRENYVKPAPKAWFKKIDPEKLQALVSKNPDLLLREMAAIFDCSKKSVGAALKKIGFTFQNRQLYTKKRMPRKV